MQTLINTVALARWNVRGVTLNRFNGLSQVREAVETARPRLARHLHRAKATVLMRGSRYCARCPRNPSVLDPRPSPLI